eukprot:8092589-Pyramimonas_sp.AAC.1
MVVLENVEGLLRRHGECFLMVLRAMQSIGYTVSWNILDSKLHGGVPQSRRRLYHVGVLRPTKPMRWPPQLQPRPLETFIDDTEFGTRLPPGRRGSLARRRVAAALK